MKTGIRESEKREIEKREKEIKRLEKGLKALLKRYSISPSYKEPSWDCSHCQDTGQIFSSQEQRIIPCPCTEKQRFELFLEGSNLPHRLQKARFERASFDYYSQKETISTGQSHRELAQLVHKTAQDLLQNLAQGLSTKGLLVYGPVGSGKSYLLGCIANEAIIRGIEVRYIVYSDLLEELRHTFNKKDISSKEIIEETQTIPLLIIDDLGTESSSEFTANTLYSIIDYRYREEKPLVITTNLDIDDLKEKFSLMGERISQRILEMCTYLPLLGQVRLEILREGGLW